MKKIVEFVLVVLFTLYMLPFILLLLFLQKLGFK